MKTCINFNVVRFTPKSIFQWDSTHWDREAVPYNKESSREAIYIKGSPY